MGKPIWVEWASDYNGAQLQVKKIPNNFKSVQQFQRYTFYKVWTLLVPDLTSFWSMGNPMWDKWQMGKRPSHCTATGLEHSIEFWTEKIHQAVSGICTLAHGQAHMGEMGKCPWCCTTARRFYRTSNGENSTVSEICISADGQDHMCQMGNHRQAHTNQIGTWPWSSTTTNQDISMEPRWKSIQWFQRYVFWSVGNPYGWNRQVTIALHNHRCRKFQRTLNG